MEEYPRDVVKHTILDSAFRLLQDFGNDFRLPDKRPDAVKLTEFMLRTNGLGCSLARPEQKEIAHWFDLLAMSDRRARLIEAFAVY